MFRLLYISTAREAHTPEGLEAILRKSRLNNARDRITGLLIAGGRRFLQTLEGPEDAVLQTYERIRKDPRHIAPVILKSETVEDRLFPAWAMGFQPSRTATSDGSVRDDVAALVAPIDDLTLKAYFQEFVERHAA